MASAPTLTVYSDAAPCPRVEVFFDDFDAGTEYVTVYRVAGGREYLLRGAVRAATAGTLTRIDFEVPFGVPAAYRAEMFDESGLSLGFTPSASVTVTSDRTWLHNPLNPQGAVRVRALAGTAASLNRPVPVEFSRPLGRRVAVALAEPRQGVTGLVYDVFAPDVETADKVQALIGDYTTTTVPVVCIRVGVEDEPMRIPRPLFLGVGAILDEDVDGRFGGEGSAQRMVGEESAPPVPGLFIPLLTRDDIDASYATRDAIDAAYLQRVDIDRDYSLAGAATA